MFPVASNVVLAKNKESRLEALELQVAEIVASAVCSQARANSLRGISQSAEGQLYGCVAALMMPTLRNAVLACSLVATFRWR